MKKTKNKILIRMISLMLVAITLIPANIGAIIASAMVVNGTGGGGGGEGTFSPNSSFTIPTEFDTQNPPVAGMRFSVYNVYTEGPNYRQSSKSIDVFKIGKYMTESKFNVKLNKMQLIQNYYNDKNTAYDTSTTQDNCFFGSDYKIDLPNTVSEMRKWEIDGFYFGNILNLIDSGKYPTGVADLEYGDRILVEPLFPIRVNSVPYTLTPTEIALLGASMFGTDSIGTGGAAGSLKNGSYPQGTWSWISEYTNGVYPNSMRLSESFLDTNSGSLLWGPPAIGSRDNFLNILANGYGIHIAYTPTNIQRPNKCKVNVKFWLNGVQGEGKIFPLDKSYDVEKGSEFFLTKAYEVFKYKPATASTGSSFRLDGGVPDATERNMYFIQAETKDANWNHHFGEPNYPNYTELFEPIVVNNDTNLVFAYGVEGDKNTVLMADKTAYNAAKVAFTGTQWTDLINLTSDIYGFLSDPKNHYGISKEPSAAPWVDSYDCGINNSSDLNFPETISGRKSPVLPGIPISATATKKDYYLDEVEYYKIGGDSYPASINNWIAFLFNAPFMWSHSGLFGSGGDFLEKNKMYYNPVTRCFQINNTPATIVNENGPQKEDYFVAKYKEMPNKVKIQYALKEGDVPVKPGSWVWGGYMWPHNVTSDGRKFDPLLGTETNELASFYENKFKIDNCNFVGWHVKDEDTGLYFTRDKVSGDKSFQPFSASEAKYEKVIVKDKSLVKTVLNNNKRYGTITMIGQWEEKNVKFEYNANGGVGYMPSKKANLSTKNFKIDKNNFTKDNAQFMFWHAHNLTTDKWCGYNDKSVLGWYDKDNTLGFKFMEFPNQSFIPLDKTMATQTIQLVAQWQQNFTVDFVDEYDTQIPLAFKQGLPDGTGDSLVNLLVYDKDKCNANGDDRLAKLIFNPQYADGYIGTDGNSFLSTELDGLGLKSNKKHCYYEVKDSTSPHNGQQRLKQSEFVVFDTIKTIPTGYENYDVAIKVNSQIAGKNFARPIFNKLQYNRNEGIRAYDENGKLVEKVKKYVSEIIPLTAEMAKHPYLAGYKGYKEEVDYEKDTVKYIFYKEIPQGQIRYVSNKPNGTAVSGTMPTQYRELGKGFTLAENMFTVEDIEAVNGYKHKYKFKGWAIMDHNMNYEEFLWYYDDSGWSAYVGNNAVNLHIFGDKEFLPTNSDPVPTTGTILGAGNQKDLLFYAQWEKETSYNVEYRGNGGTGNIDSANVVFGTEEYNVLANTFTPPANKTALPYWYACRTEYGKPLKTWFGIHKDTKQLGWHPYSEIDSFYEVTPNTKIDSLGKITINGQQVDFAEPNDKIVFWAQWKESNYNINYDANGGTGSINGATINFDTSTYSVLANTFTPPDNSDTVDFWYAKKIKNNTLMYYGYNESNVLGWYQKPSSYCKITANTKIGPSGKITINNQQFDFAEPNDNISLVAQWEAKFNVSFVTSDGSPAFNSWNSFVFSDGLTSINGFEPSNKSNTQYFSSFDTGGQSFGIDKDCTLRLGQSATSAYNESGSDFKFIYNTNKGVTSSASQQYNTVLPLNNNDQWQFYKITLNSVNDVVVTLYKKAEVVKNYYINYDKNNPKATGTIERTLAYVNEDVKLRKNSFTLENHFFKYWYLQDDQSKLWYGYKKDSNVLGWYNNVERYQPVTDESTVNFPKSNGSITAFAQWQQKPTKFNVKFVDEKGNPAFNSWNTAVGYIYQGEQGIVSNNTSTKSFFDDSMIDFRNDGFSSYVCLGNKATDNITVNNTSNYTKLFFNYNYLNGVTKSPSQVYDKEIPLSNSKWNGYKISLNESTNEIVVTLYERYNVSYESNGGSGTMPNDTNSLLNPYAIRQNAFTKEHSEFAFWYAKKVVNNNNYWYGYNRSNVLGWYLEGTITPDKYYKFNGADTIGVGTSFGNLASINETVTFVAQWKTKFVVNFVDKNGNPAFDSWNSYAFANGLINANGSNTYEMSNKASTQYISNYNNYTNCYGKDNAFTLRLGENGNSPYNANGNEFKFIYNNNVGVTNSTSQDYGKILPLKYNDKWNYYKMSLDEASDVVTVTLYDYTYNVKFDANGGYNNGINDITGRQNKGLKLPQVTGSALFGKDKATFDHWHMYDNNTNKWYGYNTPNPTAGESPNWYDKATIKRYESVADASTLILNKLEGTVTLYAQWNTTFEVSFFDAKGNPIQENWNVSVDEQCFDSNGNQITKHNSQAIGHKKHFDDYANIVDTFEMKILVPNKFNASVDDAGTNALYFNYDRNNGLSKSEKQKYEEIIPLNTESRWSYCSVKLVNGNVEITLYDYDINFTDVDADTFSAMTDLQINGSTVLDSQKGYANKPAKLKSVPVNIDKGYVQTGWNAYDKDTKKWYGYNNGNVLGWYNKAEIKSLVTISKEGLVTFEKIFGTIIMCPSKEQNPAQFNVHFIDKNGNPLFANWKSAVRYERGSGVGYVQTTNSNASYYPSSFKDFSTGSNQSYVALAPTVNAPNDWLSTQINGSLKFYFNYDFTKGITASSNQEYGKKIPIGIDNDTDYPNWDAYMVTIDENTNDLYITMYEPERKLDITYYQPNANYSTGTTVISTFKITNPTKFKYNPTDGCVSMNVKMFNTANKLIAEETKDNIVIPRYKAQNAYVKLAIPEDMYGIDSLKFEVSLLYNGKEVTNYTFTTNNGAPNCYKTKIVHAAEDKINKPVFSLNPPAPYKSLLPKKELPKRDCANASIWDEYVYNASTKTYEKKSFYSLMRIDGGTAKHGTINPVWWYDKEKNKLNSATKKYELTRSGYALNTLFSASYYDDKNFSNKVGAELCSDSNSFTIPQKARMYYPENDYGSFNLIEFVKEKDTSTYDIINPLQIWNRASKSWINYKGALPSELNNSTRSYFLRENHYTPMWVRDGTYVIQTVVSDAWTPAGMITATQTFDQIGIKGSLYDDWRWVA